MNGSDFAHGLMERRSAARQELSKLYTERRRIDEEISLVETRLSHIEALLEAEGVEDRTITVQPVIDWSDLSVREAVTRLLAEAGRPMHADEIRRVLEERGKAFSREDPKATIVTALIRGRRRGEFVKTGPNTYRLAQMPSEGGGTST